MPNYLASAQKARAKISPAGREVNLLSSVPDDGAWNSPTTPNSQAIKVVQSQFQRGEIDGNLVRFGDIKYLAGTEVSIDSSMQIEDGDTTYNIVNIVEVKPGDVPILYKIQARS